MNPNNPLLTYRNWYLELDLDLADTLAKEISRTLCKFNFLEKAAKINLQTDEDHFSDLGLEAGKLVDLIDRLLSLNEKFATQQTAVIIFSTTSIIIDFIEHSSSVDSVKKVKHKLFKSMILEDKTASGRLEHKLEQDEQVRINKTKIQKSWKMLIKNDFNYDSIHNYLITEYLNGNNET